MNEAIDISKTLDRLAVKTENPAWSAGTISGTVQGATIDSRSPADGQHIASVGQTSPDGFDEVVDRATSAFVAWRQVPAPRRGEMVRQFGEELRKHKQDLGTLVSYEMGKSLQEGLGEVQEMIDICDFA